MMANLRMHNAAVNIFLIPIVMAPIWVCHSKEMFGDWLHDILLVDNASVKLSTGLNYW